MDSGHSPLIPELLAHQSFVRRLARQLVASDSEADDVAQDVWVSALRHPPSDRRSLVGWLVHATRSVASNRRRAAATRREHEHEHGSARSSETRSLQSAEAELAVQHRVVEAVRALDEPYRAVVLLHYYRELSHAQIAEELGVPLATVRTRLVRARARLRERLDREHGGDRGRWVHGLAGLFVEDVVRSAAGAGVSTAKGLAMAMLAKTCAAAAIVGCAAWLVWRADIRPRPPALGSSVSAERNGDAVEREGALAPADDAAASVARTAVAPPSETPTDAPRPALRAEHGWVVQGRVRSLDGAEVTGTRVTIRGLNDYRWPDELEAAGDVDSAGFFEIDVTKLVLLEGWARTPLRSLVLVAEHPAHLREEVRLAVEDRHRGMAALEELDGPIAWWAELELRTAAAIAGRVVHRDGSPAGGATVGAWRMSTPGGPPDQLLADVAACDARGEFLLRVPSDGMHAVCAVEARSRPATRVVEATMRARTDLETELVLSEGCSIEGRVLRLGEPLPESSASVVLPSCAGSFTLPSAGSQYLCWIQGAMELSRVHEPTDAEGRFRFVGLAPLTYVARAGRLPGHALGLSGPMPEGIAVTAPASGIDLPCSSAAVRLVSRVELEQDDNGLLTIRREGYRDYTCDFRGRDGIPSFTGTPGERVELELRLEGKHPWRGTLVLPSAGEELTQEIELADAGEAATLELTIEGPAEHPATEVSLGFREPDATSDWPMFVQSAQVLGGVATFENVHPGRYLVDVRADKWFYRYRTYLMQQVLEVELVGGLTCRRDVRLEVGGRIELTARDARGRILPATAEVRSADGNQLDVEFVARTGGGTHTSDWQLSSSAPTEVFPNLAEGDYTVRLEHEGHAPQVVTVRVVPGSTVHRDVVLEAK